MGSRGKVRAWTSRALAVSDLSLHPSPPGVDYCDPELHRTQDTKYVLTLLTYLRDMYLLNLQLYKSTDTVLHAGAPISLSPFLFLNLLHLAHMPFICLFLGNHMDIVKLHTQRLPAPFKIYLQRLYSVLCTYRVRRK
jgi:hypothetical protein